jgi:hypothetical protein
MARAGNVIYILFRLDVPFFLRQNKFAFVEIGESETTYSLVGESYVHTQLWMGRLSTRGKKKQVDLTYNV